ncbi:MAG: hypothetical protein KGM43_13650 [Planctomycetota bacterium]|nr:hypothetical protein [Planctomycetota bacterium]
MFSGQKSRPDAPGPERSRRHASVQTRIGLDALEDRALLSGGMHGLGRLAEAAAHGHLSRAQASFILHHPREFRTLAANAINTLNGMSAAGSTNTISAPVAAPIAATPMPTTPGNAPISGGMIPVDPPVAVTSGPGWGSSLGLNGIAQFGLDLLPGYGQNAAPATLTQAQQTSVQNVVNDLAALTPGTAPTAAQTAALQTDLLAALGNPASTAPTSQFVSDLAAVVAAGPTNVTYAQIHQLQTDESAMMASSSLPMTQLEAEAALATSLHMPTPTATPATTTPGLTSSQTTTLMQLATDLQAWTPGAAPTQAQTAKLNTDLAAALGGNPAPTLVANYVNDFANVVGAGPNKVTYGQIQQLHHDEKTLLDSLNLPAQQLAQELNYLNHMQTASSMGSTPPVAAPPASLPMLTTGGLAPAGPRGFYGRGFRLG